MAATPVPNQRQQRERVAQDLEQIVAPRIAEAESARRFPRSVIAELGAAGHFAARWDSPHSMGNLSALALFAEEFGRLLCGGLAAGVSVHSDSGISILRNTTTPTSTTDRILEEAINGTSVLCIAISEDVSGSDPALFRTTATPGQSDNWILNGTKKYISLSRTADFAMVFARTGEAATDVGFFAVPQRNGYRVVRDLGKHGTHSVETCELELTNIEIGPENVIALGPKALALLAGAMTGERISVCAQLIGALGAALEIVQSYLRGRKGRDGPLWGHQALRHRFADLVAEHKVLKDSLLQTVQSLELGQSGTVDVAALKLAVAPRVERAISEAGQMLGGAGYIDDFPLERALRDVRIARVAAGTDDIMRELVATKAYRTKRPKNTPGDLHA